MPLSEEEQRILHEMEQNLYENDRAFAHRVSADGPHSIARRSAKWAVVVFVVGFLILLVSFRSSLLLGTFGFLVMLFAALAFEHSARQAVGAGTRRDGPTSRQRLAQHVLGTTERLRRGPKRWRER